MSGRKPPTIDDLSPEQQAVARSWGKGLAVMAGAGSGKTTTLVIKCQELLKVHPDARFAAVSFTERSAGDLRAKLAERLPVKADGGALAGHWVMTIHGLCHAILHDYPREAGFDGEETMLSEPESQLLWEQAIQSLWFEELHETEKYALDQLLARETRDGLHGLLRRCRELAAYGALKMLAESEDADSRALSAVAGHVLARYERLKRRRGALDFNDLEKGADRALEHAHVRQAYHQRFSLVMVDEFQDTNPLQARIITRFCKPDASNLCVVGDPKQSIYRFRDADVSVFADFCARLPERHSLTWNFRSRPGIIDYANALCEPAFQASGMEYQALIPKKEPNPDLEPVVRLDVKDPAELGRWIAGEVARGVPLQEMALLLRKIRGNEKWLKALTSAGIPIAVGSGGLFWEDPRVRELVAFLKWWDNPGNTLSGVVFLRAPWVGIPDATIDEWVRREPTLVRAFLASGHPLADALQKFHGRITRPGELLMNLLINDKTESELGAPLLGLWHRVEDLSSRGLDFHSVVTELAHAVEDSRRERDVPPPKNEGLLSVLTLHASKGLEFPHVILVDLGAKGRSPDAPLLFWDREQGAYLGVRNAEGERDREVPVESEWRAREKEKALAESKRVFYVALTRAQERLVLVCPELPEKKPSASKKEPAHPHTLDDWRGWVEEAPAVTPAVIPQASSARALPASAKVEKSVIFARKTRLKRPRHSVTEWNLLSQCPRAYEWTYIRPRLKDAATEPQLAPEESDDLGGISYSELGTRVHALLERKDEQGLRELENEVGRDRLNADAVIQWMRDSEWMAPADGSSDVWSELPFEVPIAGEILVGAMDRVVVSEDRAAIIDFKITRKPKNAAELHAAYGTQLALYSEALSRLLGGKTGIEARIVNISPASIETVTVVKPRIDIESLAKHASAIVAGEEGRAVPGPRCRYCEFRGSCPESLQ